MKLVKSLLLGSAAGLVAVAGASAADLGVKKPTAVEYVKTCPTYGAGFFVVPGTTSCLKIVGRVRADYIIDNPQARATNANRFRVRGYVGYDHRTATEYGLLRTYVRAFFQRENGADSTTLEYAFIQFGGLTAGRVTPIFEHGWNQFFLFSGQGGGLGYHSDASYVNSIGYTFSAGGGFSASIALDDPSDRRSGIGGGGAYAGKRMPDLVAAIGYDQAWGSIKLGGVLRQVITTNFGGNADSELGYGFTAGAKINLPMLAKGSNIWASFSWGSGATSYTGWSTGTIGDRTLTATDATVSATGNISLTTAWAVMGALEHYFTPTVSASIGGLYGVHNPSGASNETRRWAVIGQVAWRPVAGFLIGGEVAYRRTNSAGTVAADGADNDRSDVVGRIRFQRDF